MAVFQFTPWENSEVLQVYFNVVFSGAALAKAHQERQNISLEYTEAASEISFPGETFIFFFSVSQETLYSLNAIFQESFFVLVTTVA